MHTPSGDPEPAGTGWTLPPAIARCELMRAGGLMVMRGLFPPTTLRRLRDDASESRRMAWRNVAAGVLAATGRGGTPSRACTVASASPAHLEIHAAPDLKAFLSAQAGVPIVTAGGGSYSWYEERADFLALHRDIVGCEATLATCLFASPGRGGLVVHPSQIGQALEPVAAGHGVRVDLAPGDTLLLLGGFVPHEVTPMDAGQTRLVSLMCYRVDL